MKVFNKISRNIKFVKQIYNNRWFLNNLLNSKNLRFIKFAKPGHFYSPLPDFNEIKKKSNKIFDGSVKVIPSIKLNEAFQLKLLKSFACYYSEISFMEKEVQNTRYYFDNSYFSYGDGVILYSFLRHFQPRKIIEIGSGFSTALMLDVNDIFFHKRIEVTLIEPHPNRLNRLLTSEDKNRCRVIYKQVQEVPVDIFQELSKNDILFIDSSHVAKTASDVVHIISNILPLLAKGVIIHFHDIIWPFEYPKIWFELGIAWNETYFIRAFLQYNEAFQILYFNSFMEKHNAHVLRKKMPLVLKSPSNVLTPSNTSLWLVKCKD